MDTTTPSTLPADVLGLSLAPTSTSTQTSSTDDAEPSRNTPNVTEGQANDSGPSAVSTQPPGIDEMGRSSAPSPSLPTPDSATQTPTIASESSAEPAPDAPVSPVKQTKPSTSPTTPIRSSPSSSAAQRPSEAQSADPPTAASPTSSPLAVNIAPNSSPSSAQSPSASSPSSSPSSSSSSSSSHPPSRRVKVYKLKDDAWLDLGTGTCAGVFLQADLPGEGEEGDQGRGARRVREEDEGAWIVVRKERAEGGKSEGSPTKGKGKGKKDKGKEKAEEEESGEKMLMDEEEPGNEDRERERGEDEDDDEDSDDDDDSTLILRTRVQPYPPGFNPAHAEEDDDEDEITSLDDAGNATVDAGGYQRQQDTLIVWTERTLSDHGEEEEVEMALSFATTSGCSEMWEFIKAARRFAAEQANLHRSASPSPSISSSDRFPLHHAPSHFSSLGTLPEPTLGNLSTLEAALRAIGRTAVGRERAASMICRTGFVGKLIKVHEEAEDLESLEDLWAICRVMQTIFLLNDSALFELVIKDDLILGVVGMLEYDPDFPTMRASYRSHLSSPTSFIPVLPTARLSAALLAKIHSTHRLHYLKDVVLARILEDSTFSMLNSHIYFNEVDIVNEVAGDRELIREVFRILEEEHEAAGAGESRGREKEASGGGVGKGGKGKERELGPKRTIGPELPDDLFAARQAKKPRLSGPPSPTSSTTSPPSTSADLVPATPPSPPSSAPAASSSGPSAASAGPPPSAPSSPPPHEKKLHATLFLSQLSLMAKNLQLPVRTTFYRTLCDRGLLSALEGALRFSDRLATESAAPPSGSKEEKTEEEREMRERRSDDARRMRTAALGLWMNVVDLSASDVRSYCLRQGKEVEAAVEEAAGETGAEGAVEVDGGRGTVLGVLIEMFKKEEDLGTKTQLAEALRVLVDVAGDGGPSEAPPRLRQEDPEAEKFLQYFYDHCMLSLVAPLMEMPERKEGDPAPNFPAVTTALLSHICDLLCFFISHHTFRSKYLVLSNPPLAKSIARLLRPKPRLTRQTHLRLAALRFIRSVVARTDDFYNRFLIKHDLIRPVLETADEEKEKDNLLGSACLEFFEYLRTTNAKALLNHLMDRSSDTVRRLATGNALCPPFRTFETLIARWEMNNEPPPLPALSASGPGNSNGDSSGLGGGATSTSMQRQRSQPRGWNARMEVEEESYFNESDDDEETELEGLSQSAVSALLASSSFGSSRRKREREAANNPSSFSSSSASGNGAASPKRPKLEGDLPLPRSQTWPGAGSNMGLVDYLGEGSDEEEDGGVKGEEGELAGGFIRERRGAVDAGGSPIELDVASFSAGTNGSSEPKKEEEGDRTQDAIDPPPSPGPPAPKPLLSLHELKRKKEEDEDGELGLLAGVAAKKKPTSPSSTTAAPKPLSSSAHPSAVPAAPKPGGFKFAFGGLKSKFSAIGGGGKAAGGGGKEEKG
ncbi:hypothetical protein JCM11641_006225 [Rhodosporidiobolus odoratus]